MAAVRDSGTLPSQLRDYDWAEWEAARRAETLTAEQAARAGEAITAFFAGRTRLELFEWAWVSDVHLGPMNTMADPLTNPQLVAGSSGRSLATAPIRRCRCDRTDTTTDAAARRERSERTSRVPAEPERYVAIAIETPEQ